MTEQNQSPLERAARALASYRYEHGADCQGLVRLQWVEKFWRYYVPEARAVLMAVREPSEDMKKAGSLAPNYIEDQSSARGCGNIFTAMIDAALGE